MADLTWTPVAPGDRTWLLMDRPNNLMHVHSMIWLAEVPDWDAVQTVLAERLVDRFPVFRRRAVTRDGVWVWADDPDFDITKHVRRVRLSGPATPAETSAYVSGRVSQPLERDKPLWEVDLIEGVVGFNGEPEGALVLGRYHHSLADGIRLVQVALSLLDPLTDEPLDPSNVGRQGTSWGIGDLAVSTARATGSGVLDFARGAATGAAQVPGAVTRMDTAALSSVWRHLRHPTRLVDRTSELASDGNSLVNTVRSVSRLALTGRSVRTVWSGTPGVDKAIWWIPSLPLADVRAIAAAYSVTVNDVLVCVVSLGVTDYLAAKGVTDIDQISWLIPISLEPFDADLPEELGNHFAVVQLPMVIGERDPGTLLPKMHERMNRIKFSAEPQLLYGVQRVIAETPAAISVPLTNFVANKTVGLLTNVPGPRAPMALAGTPITGMLGFVPNSGDQALGLCLFSYAGSVSVGISCDARLVPDPDLLAECIADALPALAKASGTAGRTDAGPSR